MKKEFYLIIVVVLLAMLGGFLFFYFLEPEKPKVDLRPIPKGIVAHPEESKTQIKKSEKRHQLQDSTETLKVDEAIEIEAMMVEEVQSSIVTEVDAQNELSQERIQTRLLKELSEVHAYCLSLKKSEYSKQHIVKHLESYSLDSQEMTLFLVDYNGNTILGNNDYEDMDARTIVLEQLQQVRKHGEGFLVSEVDNEGLKRYMVVKNLESAKLYLGVDLFELD